jgi:Zn-dependent protease
MGAGMDIQFIITKIAAFFPIFLFSICFHEFAHGLVAKWLGDRTAEMAGRLTLNPFAHGDLLGTVIFPIMGVVTGFFFGWAKPVPINERNLKNPKKDLFWIALAGPASNVLLALVMAIVIGFMAKYFGAAPMRKTINDLGQIFIITNLSLAVFNALPLHPLDGGKIIARFIPDAWDRWLEENQFMLFIVLMVVLQTRMAVIFHIPIQVLFDLLMRVSGVVWML